MDSNAQDRVNELIFGAWRTQIVYAGVKLGVIEALQEGPRSASFLTTELKLHAEAGYRLLRAMASIGLLHEEPGCIFGLTEDGRMLLAQHPKSLRAIAVLQ